jgi:hypothetical protein
VAQADVQRIAQAFLVVRSDVERDRQRQVWRHAGASRVQCELTDRDAHSADALVAEAEDALAVGDDNHGRLTGLIRENRVDPFAQLVRDVEAARAPVNM